MPKKDLQKNFYPMLPGQQHIKISMNIGMSWESFMEKHISSMSKLCAELTEMIQILMMTLLGLKVQMSLETVGG